MYTCLGKVDSCFFVVNDYVLNCNSLEVIVAYCCDSANTINYFNGEVSGVRVSCYGNLRTIKHVKSDNSTGINLYPTAVVVCKLTVCSINFKTFVNAGVTLEVYACLGKVDSCSSREYYSVAYALFSANVFCAFCVCALAALFASAFANAIKSEGFSLKNLAAVCICAVGYLFVRACNCASRFNSVFFSGSFIVLVSNAGSTGNYEYDGVNHCSVSNGYEFNLFVCCSIHFNSSVFTLIRSGLNGVLCAVNLDIC